MTLTLLPAGTDFHALHQLNPERYSFLLQSTALGAGTGSYDLLLLSTGETLQLDAPGRVKGAHSKGHSTFLGALDDWWRSEQCAQESGWPFRGGWFLYLGYELAAEIEPTLQLQPDPVLPVAFAARCDAALVRNHQTGDVHFLAEPGSSYTALAVLEEVMHAAAQPSATPQTSQPQITEEQADTFLDAVLQAKSYIAAGDIYQANLSRGWSATSTNANPNTIYQALCASNPGPFAGLAHWRGTTIVSSSPERLLRIEGGVAATRPIAGTRPRSDNPQRDEQLLQELVSDPKERAEHVMLIDLERNDLGRICEAGSVEVDEMMIVESYAHVHHIVSNVRGRVRAETTPGDAIAAVFPGGTITGCPKVRCMEIISDLESGPRGAYTGSFGYLNRDGSLDLNILIRTMVIKGNTITFRAGSGIVADSQPEAELKETRAKAKGLIRALS